MPSDMSGPPRMRLGVAGVGGLVPQHHHDIGRIADGNAEAVPRLRRMRPPARPCAWGFELVGRDEVDAATHRRAGMSANPHHSFMTIHNLTARFVFEHDFVAGNAHPSGSGLLAIKPCFSACRRFTRFWCMLPKSATSISLHCGLRSLPPKFSPAKSSMLGSRRLDWRSSSVSVSTEMLNVYLSNIAGAVLAL